MKNRRIVAASSANVLQLEGTDFTVAPLKTVCARKEFVDDGARNVEELIAFLDGYKGTFRTSCPNSSDWLEAFGYAVYPRHLRRFLHRDGSARGTVVRIFEGAVVTA